MPNGNTNFLRNKELARWWVRVCRDPRFDDVLTHARSILMPSIRSADQVQGVEGFINILESMVDGPESEPPFPSPGLHHHPEVSPTKPPTQQE